MGFHYTSSWLHYFETALKLETDPSEIVNELIECCRKGGHVAIAGAYAGGRCGGALPAGGGAVTEAAAPAGGAWRVSKKQALC